MTETPALLAHRCSNGHVTYPGHPLCPTCREPQHETVDLTDRVGEVVTWTTSMATPPGVRQPNTLAIVAFDVGGESVRVLGGTADDVAIGDRVEPVYVAELRDRAAGIRDPDSQAWDGYRFRSVE